MSKTKKEGGTKSVQKENADKPEKLSKSKYYTNIYPYLGAIAGMMRSGATMDILAEKFKVSKQTLYTYMDKFPEFFDAVKTNAEVADFEVENALFKNAKDGNIAAQIFWLKNRKPRSWRDKQHVFQASSTVVKKDYDHMTEEELDYEMELLEGIVPDEIEEEGGEVH